MLKKKKIKSATDDVPVEFIKKKGKERKSLGAPDIGQY